MRFLFRTFIAFCFALALGGAVVAWLALEQRPLVESSPQVAAADLGRVKAILKEHDPRSMPAGTVRTLSLTRPELTLLTNHLLNYYGRGAAVIQLEQQAVELEASMRVPDGPWPPFLNLRVVVDLQAGQPRMKSFRFGRLAVPSWLAETVLRQSLHFVGEGSAADLVQSMAISGERLRITYRWRPELLDTVRRRLVPSSESERLETFHERLVGLAGEQTKKRVSVTTLLTGLFRFASARHDENPVADNRAILMVLGAYVNGRTLEPLVPEARDWRRPKRLTLTLDGRKDLALHFLTSAALAVTGGGFFADAMGIYKEVVDAKKGSGFSFSDLAADRAGTRFGELATKSGETAKKVWQVFAGSVQEKDFMPSIENLPEFMSESDFHSRFGEVGSPAYNRLAQEIEQRIASLSLYRQHSG